MPTSALVFVGIVTAILARSLRAAIASRPQGDERHDRSRPPHLPADVARSPRSATAAPPALSPRPLPRSGSILDRTGVALYTVREMMKDPAPTLEAIAKLGYRYVEGALWPSIAPAVKAAGPASGQRLPPHLPRAPAIARAWTGRSASCLPESYTLDRAIVEAKERGLQYLVVTYLQKAERGGLDDYRRVAAQLDKAGAACRKAGITLAYHAHSFEYEPISGVRPIDLLLKETSPDHLSLELDTFWASIAARTRTAMLAAHKGRVPLVHLQGQGEGHAGLVRRDEGAEGGVQGDRQRRDRLRRVLQARAVGRRPVLQRRAGLLPRQHAARQPAHELREDPEADGRGAVRREVIALLLLLASSPQAERRAGEDGRPCSRDVVAPNEPGLAVLVRRGGRTVFEQAIGVRELRTRAPIGPRTDFRWLP
jgi:hypothetical protein